MKLRVVLVGILLTASAGYGSSSDKDSPTLDAGSDNETGGRGGNQSGSGGGNQPGSGGGKPDGGTSPEGAGGRPEGASGGQAATGGSSPEDLPPICVELCSTGCEDRCETTCPDAVAASESLGCSAPLAQAFGCLVDGVAAGADCAQIGADCQVENTAWVECIGQACSSPENEETCSGEM